MSIEKYRRLLLGAGLSTEETDRLIQQELELEHKIDTMTCPDCGSRFTKKMDCRQAGPTDKQGFWFKYRCKCGYMVDRVEEIS